MEMTLDQLEELADAVDGSPRHDYSGRNMYGKKCVGVVCGEGKEFQLGVEAVAILGEEKASELARNTKTDSMGRDMIVYWPNVTCTNAIEEEEEEGDDLPDLD